jgi:hypothetical protein
MGIILGISAAHSAVEKGDATVSGVSGEQGNNLEVVLDDPGEAAKDPDTGD